MNYRRPWLGGSRFGVGPLTGSPIQQEAVPTEAQQLWSLAGRHVPGNAEIATANSACESTFTDRTSVMST